MMNGEYIKSLEIIAMDSCIRAKDELIEKATIVKKHIESTLIYSGINKKIEKMSNFNIAYKITSKHEGGYANDPDDIGGETYRGISRRYHPEWEGWIIIDSYKQHNTLKPLEFIDDPYLDKVVEEFYKTKFWIKYNIYALVDQRVSNLIYDGCVLCGSKSIHFLQEAINECGLNIIEDGILGNQTAFACTKTNKHTLINHIVDNRIDYHKSVVKKRPKQKKFLEEWIKRAESFRI